ncbi:carbohydrate ABC transporter membrane protein 1, CUT1 family [Thermomonospora echinospora]|uniref:Carbohydrate ABC transporter membrane protein 1, CUT1 family n=1 Tax=Thermomonospora echinospora TaxID=1992 RepID=A0A1H6B0R7_9ACTN|nr:sugar ABC transporter permease [Thermomonospora echinospora]SEG54408.1 carbohydrate ABC transporter membrane protein 1, CUT1 family [Thermomonospora echinospora]
MAEGAITRPAGLTRRRAVRRARLPRVSRWQAAPVTAALLVFSGYPLVYLVGLALTESTLARPLQSWVGSDNFRNALDNEIFTGSLWRSTLFAVLAAAGQLVIGTGLALALAARARRLGLLGGLLLLPLVTPPVMVGVAWKLLLAPVGGAVNGTLALVGLPAVNPLGDERGAFWTLVVIDTWQWTPFVVLLVYAALLGVPEELREAAVLDGAGHWRLLVSVVLPYLRPALLAVFLLRLVGGFKVFDIVYVVTAGGPGAATNTSTYEIQRTALESFQVGTAAAETLVFSVMVGAVATIVALVRRRAVRAER